MIAEVIEKHLHNEIETEKKYLPKFKNFHTLYVMQTLCHIILLFLEKTHPMNSFPTIRLHPIKVWNEKLLRINV